MAELAFDPQTSGGLLISLSADEAVAMLADLQQGGNLDAAMIGRVEDRGYFPIELV
jgi:selenide, water dikinase